MIRSSAPAREILSFSLLALLAACSSSDDTTGNSSTSGQFTIAPTTANVGTCRTQQFTATPTDQVTWSVDGAGAVANGLYTAPISVPTPNTATVKAQRLAQSATATVTIATAFPGAPIDLQRAAGDTSLDVVRGYAASGQRAYAIMGGVKAQGLAKSTDGGLTWGAPVGLPTGDGYASSVAIDAGNPDTVYIAIHTGDEKAESHLLVVTSKDGGATFAQTKEIFTGGNGDAARADLISPAAGHVVVSAPVPWQKDGEGPQGTSLLIWHDDASGTFGTPSVITGYDNGYHATAPNGLVFETPRTDKILVESGHGRDGAYFATNGLGKVCVSYAEYDINDARPENHYVRCSTNNGVSWGETVTVVSAAKEALIERPRVSISTDGTIVAVIYSKYAENDTVGQTAFKVSTDGGATFGAEKVLPDVPNAAASTSSPVSSAEILVDSFGVIWLAREIDNGVRVQIDKSCDKGATLSGAVDLTVTGTFRYPALYQSGAGIFGGGIRVDNGTGPTTFLLLGP